MVVTILGFASGIGVEVTRTSAGGVQPPQVDRSVVESPMPMGPGPSSPPPVNYVGVPIAGTVETPTPVGLAAPSPSPSTSRTTAAPSPKTAPRVGSASPATPSAPAVTCSTDLVSTLLDALTASPSQGLGALLPLGAPLSLLTNGLGLNLPALPLSDLLSQVTDLLPVLLTLPVGGRPTTSSPALAASCTTALSKLLPITGLGG